MNKEQLQEYRALALRRSDSPADFESVLAQAIAELADEVDRLQAMTQQQQQDEGNENIAVRVAGAWRVNPPGPDHALRCPLNGYNMEIENAPVCMCDQSIFHEFVCFDLGPVAFAIEWTKEVPDAVV